MRLDYTNEKDESVFIFADFKCYHSQDILKQHHLYKIIWCLSESVQITIDGYDIILEKNQVIFCTPLNILEIPIGIEDLVAVVFNREFYCINDHDHEVSCNGFLFYGSSYPPIITLSQKEKENFDMLFFFFKEEFETRDHIQGEMLRSLLKRLLIKSSRLIKKELPHPDIPSSQLDEIRKYNILVEKHFRQKHKVSEYADLLFKSPKTIANLFHKHSHKTPLMVINERILLEAKRLLRYSQKTSEEIALELGYKEAGHFSKFFKKHTGMSPISFKKEVLLK